MNQELKNLQQKYAINLFDWYDFSSKSTGEEKDSLVLVIGDVDDNFIFPLAKRVKHLSVVLETSDMDKVISYLSLPQNVTIYKEFIDSDSREIESKLKGIVFDYVVIPSMTKKISELVGNNLSEIVEFASTNYTNDKGSVLMAFDNKNSFNVIGGAKVDDELISFTYEDINHLQKVSKEKFAFSNLNIYYPLPEYRFPLRIYSDKYLPKLEDENEMTRNLVAIGKFNTYCNSYILVFDAKKIESKENEWNTVYVKYNLNRTKRFALRTSIMEDSAGKKQVIKKAVYKEANKQVRDMVDNVSVINNKNIEIIKPTKYVSEYEAADEKAYAVYPFINGETLTDVIIDRIKKGEKEKEVITEYMYKIIGKFSGIIQS